MPCDCSHMEATQHEREASRVACFLDELDGKKWDSSDYEGYHPAAYGKLRSFGIHEKTAELCQRLQEIDVTKYSLEMQIWWRDHQEADRKKIKRDLAKKKKRADREKALSKLTSYERGLLGL